MNTRLAPAALLTACALTMTSSPALAEASVAPRATWQVDRVALEVMPGGGPLGAALLEDAAAAAQTWRDEGLGPVIDVVRRGGPAELGDGRNTVELVYRGWPDSPDRLAITRKLKSGDRLLEADILVNAERFRFAQHAAPSAEADTWDLQSLLTHELGHLLGLGHLDDAEATMHPDQRPGDVRRRDLSPLDVESLAAAYAGTRDASPTSAGGCAAGGPGTAAPCAFLVFVAAVFARRRSIRR